MKKYLWLIALCAMVGAASADLIYNPGEGGGSGGSGDLTAVQVSGSILTVASGTGPIPVVGLTTAAVQSAQITYTAGTGLGLGTTDFNLNGASVASLALADSATQPADSVTTLDATAWRTLYSDASGNITELALGTSGQHLKSNGASSAPTWETPSAGGGSQTPWTNNVDAAGFALTALDYTSMNTNAAAVTGVAGKLVQYVLNDRLYSVYNSVTNYSVLN